MSDFLSFHLPDDFVKPYSRKTIAWGYPCGGNNALGEITYLTKYSRLKEDGTKERWHETCRRVIEGYYSILKDYCRRGKNPWIELKAQSSAKEAYIRMFEFKWLPPGRGIQFMGTALVNKEHNSGPLYNCAALTTDKLSTRSVYDATYPFVRLMEMSMNGIGCIASGAYIDTTVGPKKIEELEGIPFTAIIDGQEHLAPLGSWCTGLKTTITINTAEGQTLTLTPDHRVSITRFRRTTNNKVIKNYEWVKAKDLQPTDLITLDQTLGAEWSGRGGTYEHGYLIGLMQGDGWLNSRPTVAAYTEDNGYQGILQEANRCKTVLSTRNRPGLLKKRRDRDIYEMPIGYWARRYYPNHKKEVSDHIEKESSEFYKGFLRGLFDADGCVTISTTKNDRAIRLTQANYNTMLVVQRMLLRLGIVSNLNLKRQRSPLSHSINGKRCKQNACWELNIRKSNIREFATRIGFSHTRKAFKLKQILEQSTVVTRGLYTERFVCSVVSVIEGPRIETWDISVPTSNCFNANGIRVHNCGFDLRGAGKLELNTPIKAQDWTFVIPDTREGWVASVGHLLESYFFKSRKTVKFDYSQIRPAGIPLVRFGGISSGPEPLQSLHESLQKLLDNREDQLISSLDILDIMNLIGKTVVAGSIRRSAELALGDKDDEKFLDAKDWNKNPDRMGPNGWGNLSNNSVIASSSDDLSHLTNRITLNGEPGIVFLDIAKARGRLLDGYNPDPGVSLVNPCVTDDTWILTDSGARQVKDLIEIPFKAIVNGKAYPSTGFWKTGEKTVIKLVFKDGRELTLTSNHKVLTAPKITAKKRYEVWKDAGNLKPGDKVILHNHRQFNWKGEGTFDEGYVIGHLIGDGTFGQDKAVLEVWEKDPGHLGPETELKRIVTALGARSDFQGWVVRPNKEAKVMSSVQLTKMVNSYGVYRGNKIITEAMEKLSSDFSIGLVRGLFDTDGSPQGTQNKGVSFRISQINKKLLQAVQRILARIGINSHIYFRKEAGTSFLPNGKGSYAYYPTKPVWELVIAKDNLPEFYTRIGSYDTAKNARMKKQLENYNRKLNRERFTATVEKIEKVGLRTVYDCSVQDVNAFDANGFYVHNCSEIFLISSETCNLVECFPYHHSDLEDFKSTIKYAYMYSKAVTLLPTPWEETNEIVTRNRRIGASVSGVAQFAEEKGWGELRKWCDEGYKTICERDRYYSSWLGIRESIRKTTVKPSGSISLLCHATPGVHWPTASGYYIRRQRFGKHDPILEVFRKAGYKIEDDVMDPKSTAVIEFPVEGHHMRDANKVSIWEKTALAALMQEYWSDNSVSVTVTFKDEEKDQIAPILRAFAGKLKSISFLPSRPGVYKQAPYEAITEEEYKKMISMIKKLDMNVLYSGKTVGQVIGDKYCGTDACELSELLPLRGKE